MTPLPYGYRIMVKDPPADDQRSAGGLIVPTDADSLRRGIVSRVGQSPPEAEWDIEPGDTVWYPAGCGRELRTVDSHGTDTITVLEIGCIWAVEPKEKAT